MSKGFLNRVEGDQKVSEGPSGETESVYVCVRPSSKRDSERVNREKQLLHRTMWTTK